MEPNCEEPQREGRCLPLDSKFTGEGVGGGEAVLRL